MKKIKDETMNQNETKNPYNASEKDPLERLLRHDLELKSIDGQITISNGRESITVDGVAFFDLIYSPEGKRLLRDALMSVVMCTKPHNNSPAKSRSHAPQKKERGMDWWVNFSLGIAAETAEPDHVYSCFPAPSKKGNKLILDVLKSDRA